MAYKPKAAETLPLMTTERIFKLADEFRREWSAELDTEAKIKNKVHSLLESSFRRIVLLYMGARDDYGRFEIDNCNGRQSGLRSQIEAMVLPAVTKLVKKHAAEITEEGLTQAEVDGLRKGYQEHLRSSMRNELYKRSQRDAEILLDTILAEDSEYAQKLINAKIGGEELAKGDVDGTP